MLETLQNSDLNARLNQQYQPFKALIREDSTKIERNSTNARQWNIEPITSYK
nr:MAG TPA: hypothetical protein [Caudoviricetes sp.]